MAVHIGQEIWKAMKRAEMTREHFAKALQVSKTKVNNIFGNASIDTNLLVNIGQILDQNFFSLYLADSTYTPAENTRNLEIQTDIEKLKVLVQEKNKLLKLQSKTIKSLEDIILSLEKNSGL
ncbi:hypothetical protein ACJVDH_07220 [Pedobacter sp. AW1-32]|uniref:hypothetical protein n=1 Tax=Pedobacter sp. AW1-32 TaxID=3383026 RepID=UPI003FEFF74E